MECVLLKEKHHALFVFNLQSLARSLVHSKSLINVKWMLFNFCNCVLFSYREGQSGIGWYVSPKLIGVVVLLSSVAVSQRFRCVFTLHFTLWTIYSLLAHHKEINLECSCSPLVSYTPLTEAESQWMLSSHQIQTNLWTLISSGIEGRQQCQRMGGMRQENPVLFLGRHYEASWFLA